MSRTMMENEDDPAFPWESVAVHTTNVVPSGNVDPDDGLQVAATGPSTVSVASAEKEIAAPPDPVASATMAPGIVRAGGVVSTTWMVNAAEAVLPWPSVAWQLTVVAPNPKIEPEAGVQTGVRLPSTRSWAVAVKVAVAPDAPVASIVVSSGTINVGGVVSTTMTVKDSDAVFPWESVAVHTTVVVPSGNIELEAGVH